MRIAPAQLSSVCLMMIMLVLCAVPGREYCGLIDAPVYDDIIFIVRILL
jgi:hypothetical protein